jgi:hypothetical protein
MGQKRASSKIGIARKTTKRSENRTNRQSQKPVTRSREKNYPRNQPLPARLHRNQPTILRQLGRNEILTPNPMPPDPFLSLFIRVHPRSSEPPLLFKKADFQTNRT